MTNRSVTDRELADHIAAEAYANTKVPAVDEHGMSASDWDRGCWIGHKQGYLAGLEVSRSQLTASAEQVAALKDQASLLNADLAAKDQLLREAVDLIGLAGTSCEHVHHAKADQHTTISCPVEARFSDWERRYWAQENPHA